MNCRNHKLLHLTESFETDLLIAMEMDLKFRNQIIVWDKFTAPKHLEMTKMKMT